MAAQQYRVRGWLVLLVLSAVISSGFAQGGVATQELRSICRDAVHLQISGPIRDGRRPIVFTSSDPSKIARVVAMFDLVDPDVSGVAEGEFRGVFCPCIWSYILEFEFAHGARLTIGVIGSFTEIHPPVSLHEKYLGVFPLTDESHRRLQETFEATSRRSVRHHKQLR